MSPADFNSACKHSCFHIPNPTSNFPMKFASFLLTVAVLTTVPVAASFAATTVSETDCSTWLTKADTNGDGSLGGTEADFFVEKMTGMDMKPKNAGILEKEIFVTECMKGTFEGLAAK